MKYLSVLMILVMILGIPFAEAATSATYATSATAVGVLSLESFLFKGTEWASPQVTAMNFGNLVQDVPGGALRGSDWYTMLVYVHSSSRPYRVTSTGTALASGSTLLPAGACIMTPAFAEPIYLPGGGTTTPNPVGTLGPRGTFAGANKAVYTCTNGAPANIHVTYAVTNDPGLGATEYVSPDQQMGTYSGSVTVSLALT